MTQPDVNIESEPRTSDGAGDIVVGVDGSEESFTALQWALREASLSGRAVNAVYAWTHSWDMGAQPDNPDAWEKASKAITEQLLDWVNEASAGIAFDPDNLKLTSVHASGTTGLLQIGADAQQIVVGRRSLGRVTRWFVGSLSSSLAPGMPIHHDDDELAAAKGKRPVVVGVDGSETSRHALRFAIDFAALHHAPLQVMFCWQLKDLGEVPGYENAIASIGAGQDHAQDIVRRMIEQADIPDGLQVTGKAFHIAAAKGLTTASRFASHLVVGSRGLSGLDARFLGSVSRQILNFAECTVTIVH